MPLSARARVRWLRIIWVLLLLMGFVGYAGLLLIFRKVPNGIVILDHLGPGYRAYWILSLVMICFWIGSALFRQTVLTARQRMIDVAGQNLFESLRTGTTVPIERFYVYLRSFETTGRLKPPFFFTMNVLQRLHTNELESFLSLALAKDGPLIGLGMPGQNVGAARLHVQDEEWKKDIELLITNATGMLVIPSAHEGTKWEINFLQQKALIQKSIFFMPPRTGQFDWRTKWEDAAKSLADLSITLPVYNERGLLFTLTANGAVANARAFSLFYRRTLRRSVEQLLSCGPTKISGAEAVRHAERRSRLLWFWGRWGIAASSLVSLPFIAWAFYSTFVRGNAPQGITPAPPLAGFYQRYQSASEIGVGQGLIDSRLFLARRHAPTEGEIDLLARKGASRLNDNELERFVFGMGEMLSYSRSALQCEAIVSGQSDEIERIRTLVQVPDLDVARWMRARQSAVLAELRQTSAAEVKGPMSNDLHAALVQQMGQQVANDLFGLTSARHNLTGLERCRLAIEGAKSVYYLPEPSRAQLARLIVAN